MRTAYLEAPDGTRVNFTPLRFTGTMSVPAFDGTFDAILPQVGVLRHPQGRRSTVETEPHRFVVTDVLVLSQQRQRSDGAWEEDPTSAVECEWVMVEDYRTGGPA